MLLCTSFSFPIIIFTGILAYGDNEMWTQIFTQNYAHTHKYLFTVHMLYIIIQCKKLTTVYICIILLEIYRFVC